MTILSSLQSLKLFPLLDKCHGLVLSRTKLNDGELKSTLLVSKGKCSFDLILSSDLLFLFNPNDTVSKKFSSQLVTWKHPSCGLQLNDVLFLFLLSFCHF